MWKNSAYSDDFKQKALGFEAGSSHIFFFILLSIIWSTRISYGHREFTHWKVDKSAQTRTILYLLSLHWFLLIMKASIKQSITNYCCPPLALTPECISFPQIYSQLERRSVLCWKSRSHLWHSRAPHQHNFNQTLKCRIIRNLSNFQKMYTLTNFHQLSALL